MPGTTLLGCVFLPLIGPAPILRLSVALLLQLEGTRGWAAYCRVGGWVVGGLVGRIQEHPEGIITSKSVRTHYHGIDGFCELVFVIGWQGLVHPH